MTFSIKLPGANFAGVSLPEGAVPTKIPATDFLEVSYAFYDERLYPPGVVGSDYTFTNSSGRGNDGLLSRPLLEGDEWVIQDHCLRTKRPATLYAAAIETGYVREPGGFTMAFVGTVSSATSYYMMSRDSSGVNMLSAGGLGYQLNDGSNVVNTPISYPSGTRSFFVLSGDGDRGLKLYDAGTALDVSLANPPANQPDGLGVGALDVFRHNAGNNSQAYVGDCYYAGYWSRQLTDAEVTQLYKAIRERLGKVGVLV